MSDAPSPEHPPTAGVPADQSVDDATDSAGSDNSEAAAAPEPGDGVADTVESLIADLERVTGERDQYQRVAAEYANFRKQSEKRQSDLASQAGAVVVSQMLAVLDACDAAILQGAEDVTPIHSSLLAALTKAGLEAVALTDVPFDPNEHEAVVREDGDGSDEQIVAEVLRTGYRFNGKLLRAAMVKVRG